MIHRHLKTTGTLCSGHPHAADTTRPLAGKMCVVLLVIPLLFAGTPGYAQKSRENAIKAAAVFQFLRFVEWPPEYVTDHYVIGVVSGSPLQSLLPGITADKTVNGLPIDVIEVGDPAQVVTCHILYIEDLPAPQLAEVLKVYEDLPVLIVGDGEDLVDHGGHIGFILRSNKTRFNINLQTVRKHNLKISSQLLKLAIKVIE